MQETLDNLSEAETTRLIIRMRRRLAEAERRVSVDVDEAGVVAAIVVALRELAVSRPHLAPKLDALIEHYAPIAALAG